MNSRSKIPIAGLAMLLGWLLVEPSTQAIVHRHDVREAEFLKLGRPHAAVCRILPDGTGTLIAPDWVLTAAHVGHHLSPGKAKVSFNRKKYTVKEIILHPRGKQSSGTAPPDVDMALLRLDKAVKKIKPIELYRGNQEEGQLMLFVGYGDTGDGRTAPKHTDGKRRAATNVVEKVDDDHLYFTFDEPPSGTELEGVSGPGDSGGPALLEVDGRMLLGGISSASMGDPGRYGITEVYARVSPHIAWIEKSMAAQD